MRRRIFMTEDIDKSPEDIFEELTALFTQLGWVFAMNPSDEGSVSGIVAGTVEYVKEVIDLLPEEYEVYSDSPTTESEIH
jgi:hypothetical protein